MCRVGHATFANRHTRSRLRSIAQAADGRPRQWAGRVVSVGQIYLRVDRAVALGLTNRPTGTVLDYEQHSDRSSGPDRSRREFKV